MCGAGLIARPHYEHVVNFTLSKAKKRERRKLKSSVADCVIPANKTISYSEFFVAYFARSGN